jgi:flagellin
MLSINSNYASAFASNAANTASKGLDSAMEKLSTGSRINYAKDDAAGQAISTRLSAEIQGLAMASRNAADAQSLIDTAEGGMQETHTVLLRMRELAVQSANGTLTDADRQHTDAEFKQLQDEMDRISGNTKWAGQNLLNGQSFSFQVGEGANQTINVNIGDMDSYRPYYDHNGGMNSFDGVQYDYGASNLGIATSEIELETVAQSQRAIEAIDLAIDYVSSERANLGAVSNRLDSTMSNLDQVAVNLSASQGRIQDADFAQETGNLAKNQILQQAATAMIAQANASKSSVLSLIR